MATVITTGQKVRLRDLNKVYTSFVSAFKALGFKDLVRNPHNPLTLQKHKDEIFEVFAVGSGPKYNDLIGIQNEEGVQILVKSSGVHVVMKRPAVDLRNNFTL